MTDGQVFYLAACAAIGIAATIEWAWRRRQWVRVIEQDGERNERRIRFAEAMQEMLRTAVREALDREETRA